MRSEYFPASADRPIGKVVVHVTRDELFYDPFFDDQGSAAVIEEDSRRTDSIYGQPETNTRIS